MQFPDWAVHMVAVLIMTAIAGYVRLLVKSVVSEIKHTKALVDAEIAPMKAEISSFRKFAHWASDSLITLAAKANVTLPGKHE